MVLVHPFPRMPLIAESAVPTHVLRMDNVIMQRGIMRRGFAVQGPVGGCGVRRDMFQEWVVSVGVGDMTT